MINAGILRRVRLPSFNRSPQGLNHDHVWTDSYVEKLWQNVQKGEYVRNYVVPLNDRINGYLRGCKSVLDVGCGWMPYEPDNRYTGLDVSAAMVKRAQQIHPSTKIIQHDAYELPFANSEFEGIRSSGMLRHMRDWRTPLKEMVRVCDKRLAFTHLVGGREAQCGKYQWNTTLGEILKLLPTQPQVWVLKTWPTFESVLFMLEVK